MFGLFDKQDPNRCPIPEDNRIWLENSFSMLLDMFGKELIKKRKIVIPHHSDFPIKYNGDEKTAIDTLQIVAKQMEVAIEDIHLDFYSEGTKEISTGSPLNGGRVFLKSFDDSKYSAGRYLGKQEDNKFHIWLEKSKLTQPENMVATLAHEIAHIKLLGENRIEENDEKLTDLTTIIFGLGIFNANSAFQTFRGVDYSGWRKMGYLTQMEWGYGLSLLAHIRGEKLPEWINYLSLNIRGDFKQGEKFIENNKHLILQNILS
jgi:hypothetical protein